MNPNRLAKALGVDRQNVYEIVHGRRAVSADMALRLGRWSGMRPGFWLGLQADYDLQMAEWERGDEIAEQVEPLVTAG
ncbi:HigA family addiction module antitoxin [Rubrobacter tropicus]